MLTFQVTDKVPINVIESEQRYTMTEKNSRQNTHQRTLRENIVFFSFLKIFTFRIRLIKFYGYRNTEPYRGLNQTVKYTLYVHVWQNQRNKIWYNSYIRSLVIHKNVIFE